VFAIKFFRERLTSIFEAILNSPSKSVELKIQFFLGLSKKIQFLEDNSGSDIEEDQIWDFSSILLTGLL